MLLWFGLAAVFLALLSIKLHSTWLVYAAVLLAGVFVFSSQVLVYAFVGHLYPPEVRGTALGMSAGVGRVGAIVGPSLGGALVTAGIAYPWGFYAFAVAAVLAVLALATVPAHAPEPASHVVTEAGFRRAEARGQTGDVAGNVSSPGATVTSRALALVGAFDEEHRRLTLTELAQRAGLPVPTAHRLVGELVAWGALARTSAGDYVIGRRLWDLGLLAPHNAGLVELASPYLHDLYGATLATVHLAVREGTEVLYLDRLRGSTSVPIVSTVGTRLPMHATGVGKVLLAHAPPEVQRAVLADLPRITAYTITQPGTLQRQLAAVLRDDHATTVEEMSLGACSVGVPVRRAARTDKRRGRGARHRRAGLKRDKARLVSALQVAARGIGRVLARADAQVRRG